MASTGARHALIIGGGIAGPALALFLRRIGVSCVVYEARPETEAIGGGLNLAPNGMRVLEALGLAEAMTALGSPALEHCFRTERGRVLARYDNSGPEDGPPALNLRRADVCAVLASELARRGIPIEHGKRLTDIAVTSDGVEARFADGTLAEGSLLIGADGVRSSARRLVMPEAPEPAYVGIIGVGGFVPEAAVPELSRRERHGLTFTYGAEGFFGYGGGRPGEIMWWSNLWRDTEPSRAELADLAPEAIRAEMLAIYERFHAPIPALIEHTGPPVKLSVFDLQTLPRWSRGRVVLVGDAAHAVSPNSGQGASLALEDAMYLARVLREVDDPEEAFGRFEHDRRPRCERVVAEGRRRSSDKKRLSRTEAMMRNVILATILPLFGRRSLGWMYRYRIDW
jgi:2-polyprenyl-6-methoxyphenol hydroxylase-like FAD-dependent oxidoreductase